MHDGHTGIPVLQLTPGCPLSESIPPRLIDCFDSCTLPFSIASHFERDSKGMEGSGVFARVKTRRCRRFTKSR